MGPIWDFDLGFGGYFDSEFANTVANIPENFYIKNVPWINRMFEDPAFLSLVKERMSYYYLNRQSIYDYIDANAAIIKKKIVPENDLWLILYSVPVSEDQVKTKYQLKVDYLKSWIESRMTWLYENINLL